MKITEECQKVRDHLQGKDLLITADALLGLLTALWSRRRWRRFFNDTCQIRFPLLQLFKSIDFEEMFTFIQQCMCNPNEFSHTDTNLLRLVVEGVLLAVLVSWSFLKLLSSVFLSLPGHAQTRTSKDLRPSIWPLQDKSKSRFYDLLCPHTNAIHEQRNETSTTYSWVSRVMIVRMGRRFMPPMQLLLHM